MLRNLVNSVQLTELSIYKASTTCTQFTSNYKSTVVIYEHKIFIRMFTGHTDSVIKVTLKLCQSRLLTEC